MPLIQRLRHASVAREALQEWIQDSLNAAPAAPFFDGRIMMTEEACLAAVPAATAPALTEYARRSVTPATPAATTPPETA